MAELDVHIRRLPPMCVAVAQAVGPSPEEAVWRKLVAWAEPAGLLADPASHPIFGFNNPPPEPGQDDYGYEVWIQIEPDMPVAGGLERKEFAGGRYAVTTCRLHDDPSGCLPDVWQKLLTWVEASSYRWRRTHELEHLVNPGADEQDLVLELLLPIEEE
jgi:DNA gyrase inhibitor GyrI